MCIEKSVVMSQRSYFPVEKECFQFRGLMKAKCRQSFVEIKAF